jgi:hypothetical protein
LVPDTPQTRKKAASFFGNRREGSIIREINGRSSSYEVAGGIPSTATASLTDVSVAYRPDMPPCLSAETGIRLFISLSQFDTVACRHDILQSDTTNTNTKHYGGTARAQHATWSHSATAPQWFQNTHIFALEILEETLESDHPRFSDT